MIRVELYSKEECHLCDVALVTLQRVQHTHPFNLTVIKIEEGTEQYDEFKERIPVVFIDKKFAFQYRVPEQEFITKLFSVMNES